MEKEGLSLHLRSSQVLIDPDGLRLFCVLQLIGFLHVGVHRLHDRLPKGLVRQLHPDGKSYFAQLIERARTDIDQFLHIAGIGLGIDLGEELDGQSALEILGLQIADHLGGADSGPDQIMNFQILLMIGIQLIDQILSLVVNPVLQVAV